MYFKVGKTIPISTDSSVEYHYRYDVYASLPPCTLALIVTVHLTLFIVGSGARASLRNVTKPLVGTLTTILRHLSCVVDPVSSFIPLIKFITRKKLVQNRTVPLNAATVSRGVCAD